jgi:hypothetical protein
MKIRLPNKEVIIVVLDLSRSMLKNVKGVNKIELALKILSSLPNNLAYTLIGFAKSSFPILETVSKDELIKISERINCIREIKYGSNPSDGLQDAVRAMFKYSNYGIKTIAILLIWDGGKNEGVNLSTIKSLIEGYTKFLEIIISKRGLELSGSSQRKFQINGIKSAIKVIYDEILS